MHESVQQTVGGFANTTRTIRLLQLLLCFSLPSLSLLDLSGLYPRRQCPLRNSRLGSLNLTETQKYNPRAVLLLTNSD